jgi:hypothetical protein
MPELDSKAQSLRPSGPSSIYADDDTEIASIIVFSGPDLHISAP